LARSSGLNIRTATGVVRIDRKVAALCGACHRHVQHNRRGATCWYAALASHHQLHQALRAERIGMISNRRTIGSSVKNAVRGEAGEAAPIRSWIAAVGEPATDVNDHVD